MAMRCPHCGSVVEPTRDSSGALFCPVCQNTGAPVAPKWTPLPAPTPPGYPASPYGPPGNRPFDPHAPPGETPGKAVAALVLGILSFVLFPLAIVLGPLAIVYGVKAQRQLKRSPPGTPGQGLAVTGIVLGSIGVLFGITIVMAAIVFVLVSNLGASQPEFTFEVDPSGPGGVLTVLRFNGTADWSDYELGGEARCTLPNGEVEAGDEIVCVTDGDVVLIDWLTEETVYATTV